MDSERDWATTWPVAQGAVTSLVRRLVELELTVATAESLTGGLCSAAIVEVPDSGEIMLGSVVAYSTDEKRRLLGVSQGPVISSRCALEMADGVRRLLGADAAVAITGVAGPAPQEDQPVGTVFVAATVGNKTRVRHFRFDGSPNEIRWNSVALAASTLTSLIETACLPGASPPTPT
jgi:PncC family amidohydrolase